MPKTFVTAPTGGPAFPRDEYYDGRVSSQTDGMTLRDYFAAKAVSGMLSDPNVTIGNNAAVEILALGGYRIADAMLKVRLYRVATESADGDEP